MNIQGLFSLGLTGLISFQSKGLSKVFSSTTIWKHQFFWHSAFFMVQLSQMYMTTGKIIALTIQAFVNNAMSLLFNLLSRFVTAFLPRSKRLWISWLQSPSAVILEPRERKSVTASTFPSYICHEVMGSDATTSVFECWVLSQPFYSPLSPSSRVSLVLLHFLPSEWYHLHIWNC